jgi:MFS transporter, FSR family, fosmidomycin resistance protein
VFEPYHSNTDSQRRTLWSACAAHILHDGYADLIYVLLPVWQAEFGIGFGALAAVRAPYLGAMAGLQLPIGRMASRFDGRSFSTRACGWAC